MLDLSKVQDLEGSESRPGLDLLAHGRSGSATPRLPEESATTLGVGSITALTAGRGGGSDPLTSGRVNLFSPKEPGSLRGDTGGDAFRL